MGREEVTLTLDSDLLDELRSLVGEARVPVALEEATTAYVKWLQRLRTADEWLAELNEPDKGQGR